MESFPSHVVGIFEKVQILIWFWAYVKWWLLIYKTAFTILFYYHFFSETSVQSCSVWGKFWEINTKFLGKNLNENAEPWVIFKTHSNIYDGAFCGNVQLILVLRIHRLLNRRSSSAEALQDRSAEAATRGVLWKKLFFKISQYS